MAGAGVRTRWSCVLPAQLSQWHDAVHCTVDSFTQPGFFGAGTMGIFGDFFPKPIDFHEDAKDGVPSAAKLKESVVSYNSFQLKLNALMMAPIVLTILKSRMMGETAEEDTSGGTVQPEGSFDGSEQLSDPTAPPLRLLGDSLTSVVFVGDLHGDHRCGREWIERTSYVNFDTQPWSWKGPEDAAIVLLGDYVDRGPSSRATLELVRDLEDAFPTHVVAMMGNHDLFTLLDVALEDGADRPMGAPVLDFTYAFTHPQTYIESGWVTPREDDVELLAAVLRGLQSVYKDGAEQRTMMAPTPLRRKHHADRGAKDMFEVAEPFVGDESLAERARTRLHQWQSEYAAGLVSSGLADWLRRRPLVAIVGDALVVHGGIPLSLLRRVGKLAEQRGLSLAEVLDDQANQAFARSWRRLGRRDGSQSDGGLAERGAHTIAQDFQALLSCYPLDGCHDEQLSSDLISEIVQNRDYFDAVTGCKEVEGVLDMLGQDTGVTRIVVGHTAGVDVRESCDGKLLATDSSLSKHVRAFGNLYCPIDNHRQILMATKAAAEAVNKVKGDGGLAPACSVPAVEECEGSIAQIKRPTADGTAWAREASSISASGFLSQVPQRQTEPGATCWPYSVATISAVGAVRLTFAGALLCLVR